MFLMGFYLNFLAKDSGKEDEEAGIKVVDLGCLACSQRDQFDVDGFNFCCDCLRISCVGNGATIVQGGIIILDQNSDLDEK